MKSHCGGVSRADEDVGDGRVFGIGQPEFHVGGGDTAGECCAWWNAFDVDYAAEVCDVRRDGVGDNVEVIVATDCVDEVGGVVEAIGKPAICKIDGWWSDDVIEGWEVVFHIGLEVLPHESP